MKTLAFVATVAIVPFLGVGVALAASHHLHLDAHWSRRGNVVVPMNALCTIINRAPAFAGPRSSELGEHSSEILAEAGLTPEEIARFRGKGRRAITDRILNLSDEWGRGSREPDRRRGIGRLLHAPRARSTRAIGRARRR